MKSFLILCLIKYNYENNLHIPYVYTVFQVQQTFHMVDYTMDNSNQYAWVER